MKKAVIAVVLATAIAGATTGLTGCSVPVEVKGKTFYIDTSTQSYSRTYPEKYKKKTSALETEYDSIVSRNFVWAVYTFKEDGKFYNYNNPYDAEMGTYVQDGGKLTLIMPIDRNGNTISQECTVKGDTIVMSYKSYYKLDGEILIDTEETTDIYDVQTTVMKESKGERVDGKIFKYSKVEIIAGGTVTEEHKTKLKNEYEDEYKNFAIKFDETKRYSSNDGGTTWEAGTGYEQYGGIVFGNEKYILDGGKLCRFVYDHDFDLGALSYYCIVKIISEITE